MGCFGSKAAASATPNKSSRGGSNKNEITCPSVIRQPTKLVVNERQLPLGARCHGAEVLAAQGRTGRGVKVAGIDFWY